MTPILYIVIPCYNEEAVLPITAPLFLKKIQDLSAAAVTAEEGRGVSGGIRRKNL